jgi:hypothetical protein
MRYRSYVLILLGIFLLAGISFVSAQEETTEDKGGLVPKLSESEQIRLAMSAAPEPIARNATVMTIDQNDRLVTVKEGTNEFTCLSDLPGSPKADPICMDPHAKEFIDAMLKKAPKPTNKEPGIAYMANGGQHWEKDGRVLMEKEPGAKLVDEPPHWMVFWPFDPQTTGLPTEPNQGGVYIMFAGTPYAHLMVYQDPNKLPATG